MATLQAGQTVSIQLAEGESYTVTPSGTAQVSTRGVSGSELSAPRTLTSAQTFGPYTEAGAISIACLSGTVDYTQAGGPVYQDPATGALVGAGGEQLTPRQTPATADWALSASIQQAARRTTLIKRFIDQIGVTYNNSGTPAVPSIDAASPFGRSALKLVIPNGNAWAEVQLTGLNVAEFDDHIMWRVWIEDYTGISQVQVYAGTSAYSRYFQSNHLLQSSSTNRWNGEHPCVTGPTRAQAVNTFVPGSDTLSDTKIRITPVAGADRNIWIEAVVVPSRGPGVVLLTYDDGFRSWINYVNPDLVRNGLVGSFAFQSNLIGTNDLLYLNANDLRTLRNAGHELSPHQVANTRYNDGTSGTQTASQYQADYRTCSAALRAILGVNAAVDYHPYVQGGVNQTLIDTLRADGLRVGRGVDNVRHNFHTAGLGRSVYSLKTGYMDSNGPDLATLMAAVDDCEKYGTTLVLMGHDFSPGATAASTLWSSENHATLTNYIGEKVRSAKLYNTTVGAFAGAVYGAGLVERQFRLEIAS